MTTTIHGDDALPAYVALSHGLAKEALQHMSSRRLNVLAYILGGCQVQVSVPRRSKGSQPRDEKLVIDVGWLMRASGLDEDTTVGHVMALGLEGWEAPWEKSRAADSPAFLAKVVDKGSCVHLTVPQDLAYPRAFSKMALPLLTGGKELCQAYLELAAYLHRGGRKPLGLSVYLDDEDLDRLQQHVKRLDRQRLDGHVTVPRHVARHGFDIGPAPTTITLTF